MQEFIPLIEPEQMTAMRIDLKDASFNPFMEDISLVCITDPIISAPKNQTFAFDLF